MYSVFTTVILTPYPFIRDTPSKDAMWPFLLAAAIVGLIARFRAK